MTAKKARPTSVSEYIEAAPKEAKKKLREMRACIRKAAPGATEGMKWGMPALRESVERGGKWRNLRGTHA